MIHSIIVRCTRFSSVFLVLMLDSSSCVCLCLCLCMLIRQEHTFAALNWRLRHKIELDRMQFSKQLLLFEAFCILAFGSLCHMCYIASIHWWHLRFTCETYYTRKILRASKLMHQCRFGVFWGEGTWGELFLIRRAFSMFQSELPP